MAKSYTARWFGFATPIILFWLVLHSTIGPAVARAKLAQIEQGMSQSQVREILGQPYEISSLEEWKYSRPLNLGWVEVWFDETGKVREVNDESMFP